MRKSEQPNYYRICQVCGMRHAATYGYRSVLILYGIDGDKAAPGCISNLMQNRPKYSTRRAAIADRNNWRAEIVDDRGAHR